MNILITVSMSAQKFCSICTTQISFLHQIYRYFWVNLLVQVVNFGRNGILVKLIMVKIKNQDLD